jgi:hypothetical protein
VKVHAPPVPTSTGRQIGAYCRFIHWPSIGCLPEDVTCGACITKMQKRGVPRKGWTPLPFDRLWGKAR